MNTTEQRFEDRLLSELLSVVAANHTSMTGMSHVATRRLRRPAAVGAGLALGGATIAALLITGGSGPAYAVDPHPDGSVTVTIKSLTDASGLERKLNTAGIRAVVDYLPEGKTCQQPRFENPATAGAQESISIATDKSGTATFTITKHQLSPADTLVIESNLGRSGSSIGVSVASGTVAPCTVIDADPLAPAPGSGIGSDHSNGSGRRQGSESGIGGEG